MKKVDIPEAYTYEQALYEALRGLKSFTVILSSSLAYLEDWPVGEEDRHLIHYRYLR